MSGFPSTTRRVAEHTAADVNRQIAEALEERVRSCATNPGQIESRLRELEEEWDTERTLEALAGGLAFAGTALAILAHRRWLALSLVMTGSLLQHAVQGWCPPLSVLRRLGVRTPQEIGREQMALKALRGDFHEIDPNAGDPAARAAAALAAARA